VSVQTTELPAFMKPRHILILSALTGTAFAQGPLTPPPGADPSIGPVHALTAGGLPQATMKTLHQVEPRTAIAGGTHGATLNQSWAYYLTGNITVATGEGITINASNAGFEWIQYPHQCGSGGGYRCPTAPGIAQCWGSVTNLSQG